MGKLNALLRLNFFQILIEVWANLMKYVSNFRELNAAKILILLFYFTEMLTIHIDYNYNLLIYTNLPVTLAAFSCSTLTVGSSPSPSYPTSANDIALLISSVGVVSTSLYKSIIILFNA